LQAKIAKVSGSAKLNADEVAGVLARTAGDRALIANDSVGHDLARNAKFAGGFFEKVIAAIAAGEQKSMADVGEGHGIPFGLMVANDRAAFPALLKKPSPRKALVPPSHKPPECQRALSPEGQIVSNWPTVLFHHPLKHAALSESTNISILDAAIIDPALLLSFEDGKSL